MHSKSTLACPEHLIGTSGQTIWVPRGGNGQTSGSGPSGWKLRPVKVLARSLAEMASHYRKVKK